MNKKISDLLDDTIDLRNSICIQTDNNCTNLDLYMDEYYSICNRLEELRITKYDFTEDFFENNSTEILSNDLNESKVKNIKNKKATDFIYDEHKELHDIKKTDLIERLEKIIELLIEE